MVFIHPCDQWLVIHCSGDTKNRLKWKCAVALSSASNKYGTTSEMPLVQTGLNGARRHNMA